VGFQGLAGPSGGKRLDLDFALLSQRVVSKQSCITRTFDREDEHMSNAESSAKKTIYGKPAMTFQRPKQILAQALLALALALLRVHTQINHEDRNQDAGKVGVRSFRAGRSA
jgi:hypothetical protein